MMETENSYRSPKTESLDPSYLRNLAEEYRNIGQYKSAYFWADALVATNDAENYGDDVCLLASIMLLQGEPHRAAHTIVSRELHRCHLLCLNVTMKAYLEAKEYSTALLMLEEADPTLLDPSNNLNHNRAVSSTLVSQARALSALERREAAAEALAAALRADASCYEALQLLLEQHTFTVRQEMELLEYVPIEEQMAEAEQLFTRQSYRERQQRYSPLIDKTDSEKEKETPLSKSVDVIHSRTMEGRGCLTRRQIASCQWKEALQTLDSIDPWAHAELRAICLLELKKSSDLFVFAHTLVDAYPESWTAWFAVGLYYFLIGKSEFARRYLSKAKNLEPSAGCVWLAYGHSYARDKEHDQAIAAYIKASQLMPGCYLPPMYVGVECSLLNNTAMAQRFLLRAAMLHTAAEAGEACEESGVGGEGGEGGGEAGWLAVARAVRAGRAPECAHEACVAALQAPAPRAARALADAALAALGGDVTMLPPRWAATLDALGHALRRLGLVEEALESHRQALQLRPRTPATYTCIGLCLALLGRERAAAEALHGALGAGAGGAGGGAGAGGDAAAALLDALLDKLDLPLTEEEIPQFPFPEVQLTPRPAPAPATTPNPALEHTNTSDMSMSFD